MTGAIEVLFSMGLKAYTDGRVMNQKAFANGALREGFEEVRRFGMAIKPDGSHTPCDRLLLSGRLSRFLFELLK